MRQYPVLPLTLALLALTAALAGAPMAGAGPAATLPAAPPDPETPVSRKLLNDVPDTGQFLPDTAVLARVDDHPITVGEFVAAYFSAYAPDVPRPDSAGRAEFLQSMISKEVLDRLAAAIDRPFGFEDRLVMREHTERALSNVLFQRVVLDSIQIGEDEVRQVYAQEALQVHLRQILFADRPTAETVRAQLVRGKLKWSDAVRRYTLANRERSADGDIGWKMRIGMGYELGNAIFTLAPGQVSRVLEDEDGFHLFQCVERKPVPPLDYESSRRRIMTEIQQYKIPFHAERLQAVLRRQAALTYDTSAIVWAAGRFPSARSVVQEEGGPNIVLDPSVPEFASTDTSRVLARYRGGTVSLGRFLSHFNQLQPLTRPAVNSFGGMRQVVDDIALEPYRAQLAREKGLDKDPLALRLIGDRLERLRVEHLYQDSVASKVWVSSEERRKYYEDHKVGFITYPKVRYATIAAATKEGADSLLRRLESGERAEAILLADSLLGVRRGSIQEQLQSEEGRAFHKLVFEELKPGQAVVVGPDRRGGFAVIQLLSYDPGHQLSFEEAQHTIDDILQREKTDARLEELLERERARYRIEARPELVMRIRLVDPSY